MGAVFAKAEEVARLPQDCGPGAPILYQFDKIGKATEKCHSELVRNAIAADLGKTEPKSVEKMSRRV